MKDGILKASLRINSVGKTIPSPNWNWDSGVLRDYDLVMLTKGKGTYFSGHESWEVTPGTCMLFRRGERYLGEQDPDNPVDMAFIHFDVLDGKKRPMALAENNLPPLYLKADRFDFVLSLVQCVHAAHLESADGDEEAEVWLRALLLEMGRQAQRPGWQGAEREQSERVEAVCAEIRARIGEPWRLAEIAGRLGCGEEHAGRLFRKYRGVAPGEYVIQTRLQAAKALLYSSSLSIGQIADTLGYCDVYAFSRQFKAKTGRSPRAYRHA